MFTNPSFGVDTAGQFAQTGANLSQNPFGSSSSSSSGGGSSMLPALALGVIGAGASIFGASQARKGTENAAAKAAEASKEVAEEITKRELAKEWGGVGFDFMAQRYNTGAGAFANAFNQNRQARQAAEFEAYNPASTTLRSLGRSDLLQSYAARLSEAMPGYVSPLNLFG